MRRIRFAAVIFLAVIVAAGCAFALWTGLNRSEDSVASRFEVEVASAPSSPATIAAATPPAPTAPAIQPSSITNLASGSRVSAKLTKRTKPPVQTGTVVVRFSASDAKTTAFVAASGGRVIQSSTGRLVASLPTPENTTPDQFEASLAKRSDVVYASADEVGRLQPVAYSAPTDSYLLGPIEYHWWLNAVKAQQAWQTAMDSTSTPLLGSASSFKVAVIDTGIYFGHPDMANAQTGRDEFQSYSLDTNSYTRDYDITPYDSLAAGGAPWHGTATAGAVGAAVNGVGTVGAGYEAIPVGYKIEGPVTKGGAVIDYGMSTEAAAVAIYDATNAGCKVINMSFGGTGVEDPMIIDAENYAHAHGVLMVAAAGNDGSNAPFVPASDPNVVSVSAVATANAAETSFSLASFSNYGPHVALSAPGQEVWLPYYDSGHGYVMAGVDGTSFSSPIVAGAAAFLWRVAPTISPDQLRDVLQASAVDLGPAGRDDKYGYGLLDMNAAYNYMIGHFPLSKPDVLTVPTSFDTHSITATWTPVAGTSVNYVVSLDGAVVSSTTESSATIPDVAYGPHTITIQPTSTYNLWTSAAAISADTSILATEPLTSTVTLSASANSVTYPALSLSVSGLTNARSSHVAVQSSPDGQTWTSTGSGWTNSAAPALAAAAVPVQRNTFLRLAVTSAGWTDAVSNVIKVPYYAALKTPSAASSVRHSTTFTIAETISAPASVGASAVTFKFYRWQKSGSKYSFYKSAHATSYTKSGNSTTYRAKTSLLKTGSYRIYAYFSGGGLYATSTTAARALRVK